MTSSEALSHAQEILEKYLLERGLRRTEERLEVLRTIYEELTHFDADSLHRHLLERGLRISRATIYNTLDLFVSCGLVKRYAFAEGRTLYERSVGRRQHDHLICIECGHIQEFCDPQLGLVVEGVGRLFHMNPVHHDLVVYAHCQVEGCPHRSENSTFATK
ncbi:MAG: transcriptional repressor [Bacteroidia bacterium]|nr:transcriptional repressor [Bacteroidia bacterium]